MPFVLLSMTDKNADMSFLGKNDTQSFYVIMYYGVFGYLLSREITEPWIFSFGLMLICVVLGYYLAKWLHFKFSTLNRIAIYAFPVVLAVLFYFGANALSRPIDFHGSWTTNSLDDIEISLHFASDDSVFMSMSPFHEKVGYRYLHVDGFLVFERNEEVLKWRVYKFTQQYFVLEKQNDQLIFYRE